MTQKTVNINLYTNGKSSVQPADGVQPVISFGENSATVLSVAFPDCFREGFDYECVISGCKNKLKPFGADGEGNIKFLLPKVGSDTVVLGFCAFKSENNQITKYVKWQSVQCSVIGGEYYGAN